MKSLGRQYDTTLKDKNASKDTEEMLSNGLGAIRKSGLIGKFMIWCLQFMLIPKLLWPLLIYDIPVSTVERMEAKINKFTRKWLGVPPSLTSVALYGKNTKLRLPFKSLVEEYKAGKARLLCMLQDSPDEFVRSTEPTLKTGRKWNVKKKVEASKEALKLKEIIGHTQSNRAGLGLTSRKLYSKAHAKERRNMIIDEIRGEEEQGRLQKAVQQSQQGQWTSWENALQRSLSWNDIWHMAPLRISFIIRAVYDVLPTNSNMFKWNMAEDPNCALCGKRQTLEHVLSSCSKALALGRYTWRHNRVLNELASAVTDAVCKANSRLEADAPRGFAGVRFVSAGYADQLDSRHADQPSGTILSSAVDWEMAADLPGCRKYPTAIIKTGKRPDIVLSSKTTNQVVMIELTVPFESRLEESHFFKESKYRDLAGELRKEGMIARVFAVEVGARGLLSASVYDLLKALGINGKRRTRALKGLAESAEKASNWIWQERNSLKNE